MKGPVTPYRLTQLPTFRMMVKLPSSGQTENSKSRGRVCILGGMNRLSERKSEPMETLVVRSGRGPIIRCDISDAAGPEKGPHQITRPRIPATVNFNGKVEETVAGDGNSKISKGVFKGHFSINEIISNMQPEN